VGFCLENYYQDDYGNDGDNGGCGGGDDDVDTDVATVGSGGLGATKGNGNDSNVHIMTHQLVSLGWHDMCQPQYVSSMICAHVGNVE